MAYLPFCRRRVKLEVKVGACGRFTSCASGLATSHCYVRLEERGQCRPVYTTVEVSVHGSRVHHVWSLEGAQVVVGEWFQRDFRVGWLDGEGAVV